MPRVLRLTLAVVGLALAVYAVASLTGGWLGTPPWSRGAAWETVLNPGDFPNVIVMPPGFRYRADGTLEALIPGESRELISVTVILAGLALFAWAAWPRDRELGKRARWFIGLLGAGAIVYAAASLTGGWLGEPPWWIERVSDGYFTDIRETSGREWISAGLGVAGCVLVALAVKSRPRGTARPLSS